MRRFRSLAAAFIFSAACLSVYGCGSGSNNDQGNAFTLLGYNGIDEDGECEPDVLASGAIMPLDFGLTTETQLSTASLFGCIFLQNNMTSQSVIVQRVYHRFHIEGASVQPPDTTSPLSTVLAAAPVAGGTSTGATTNVATLGFVAVPTEIASWISLNKSSLPQPPFNMTATHSVAGVTTSGDRLVTNETNFLVVVSPDIPIAPTEGTESAGSIDLAGSDDDGGDFILLE